jgi:hypothetical protein
MMTPRMMLGLKTHRHGHDKKFEAGRAEGEWVRLLRPNRVSHLKGGRQKQELMGALRLQAINPPAPDTQKKTRMGAKKQPM